jgi:uncharacterized protein (TIGR02145 family)
MRAFGHPFSDAGLGYSGKATEDLEVDYRLDCGRSLSYSEAFLHKGGTFMRKDFNLLALAIVVAVVGLTATMAAGAYVCGDANGSGGDPAVDIDDVVYLINYIFAGGPAPDPNCCESDCPPTVTDYDGNTYFTVKIGDQCWMAQNLKVTHYRNGDPIPNVTDAGTWSGLATGAYCNYNDDEGNVAVYGKLYNWYAVDDSRNIAPAGWHVPTDAEWKQLEMYLGMSQAEADQTGWRGTDEGGKLKEADTTHWQSPNTGATNESGFSALPGGDRGTNGSFYDMGYNAYFWSSTESSSSYAWSRGLSCYNSQVGRDYNDKRYGFSVRCVRD